MIDKPFFLLPMIILGFYGNGSFNSNIDNLFVFKIIIICSTYIILDNSFFKESFEDDKCLSQVIRTQVQLLPTSDRLLSEITDTTERNKKHKELCEQEGYCYTNKSDKYRVKCYFKDAPDINQLQKSSNNESVTSDINETSNDATLKNISDVESDDTDSDPGVPDAGVPDAGVPDAGVPDAGDSEITEPRNNNKIIKLLLSSITIPIVIYLFSIWVKSRNKGGGYFIFGIWILIFLAIGYGLFTLK